MTYKFHKDGTLPENGEIFVFGSNLSGIHGAGAARAALKFGAQLGYGEGFVGQSYAIPTKDHQIHTLPLERIREYVEYFISFAKTYPNEEFFVTAIGCGLAGYTPADIAPMFKDSPENVSFPDCFQEYL